ncbi:MAG: E3 binding domain-containing protein [Anaerolineales bacterium]|nr:E3 binding domain-containing protein [Anaerolineales bacterium]
MARDQKVDLSNVKGTGPGADVSSARILNPR